MKALEAKGGGVPEYLAWWGAGLSTILALVKLWEFWRDWARVDIDYLFTSDPDRGNSISIHNLSSRPMIVSYWQVLYGSGTWPFRKFEDVAYPDIDSVPLRIDPYSTLTLNFCEETYFSTGYKALKGRNIYIRLYAAGRRPILKRVLRGER